MLTRTRSQVGVTSGTLIGAMEVVVGDSSPSGAWGPFGNTHTDEVDDGVTFGEAEASDWIHRRQLVTQGEVARFAAEAQALPEASRDPLAVVARVGSIDEQRLAVAALRCRGYSVFNTSRGMAVGAPPLRVNVFRGSSEMLVPAVDSLRIADLLADVPTREIKLVRGSEALSRWLRGHVGDRSK